MIDLDKRILDGKKPLTPFDEIDSKFIGTDCYFSDKASDFGDLKYCQIGSLLRKDEATGVFSATKNNSYAVFHYCLPCEWVKEEKKEPKYRPYNNTQELFDDIGVYIGDTIHFRSKFNQTEYHALIALYSTQKDGVETLSFGGFMHRYTMQELFDLFELRSRGEWLPFGIEE